MFSFIYEKYEKFYESYLMRSILNLLIMFRIHCGYLMMPDCMLINLPCTSLLVLISIS